MEQTTAPTGNCVERTFRSFNNTITLLRPRFGTRRPTLIQLSKQIPRPTEARLRASLSDRPVHFDELDQDAKEPEHAPKTYMYLAYGSNLSAETFLGKRGIRPLSQVNVVVPEISLTFDLPGIPYTEPCFGNSRIRTTSEKLPDDRSSDDYHKDRWKKGLVGVVYEVTAKDFAHIIATEGGGSGYKDVLVDCYTLPIDPIEEVPLVPTGPYFKAHTLLAPGQRARPDPSYAQPSARYKKLITDGAEEHNLPHEYRTYLEGIRTYQISTKKQQMGQWIFNLTWLPLLGFFFMGGGRLFLRKDGTYPPWFAQLAVAVFTAVWGSYDGFFEPLFGDGERSIVDGGKDADEERGDQHNEKTPLLKRSQNTARGNVTDKV